MMDYSFFSDLLSTTVSKGSSLQEITEPVFLFRLSSLLVSPAQMLLPPAEHSKVQCAHYNWVIENLEHTLKDFSFMGKRGCSSTFFSQPLCQSSNSSSCRQVLIHHINILTRVCRGTCLFVLKSNTIATPDLKQMIPPRTLNKIINLCSVLFFLLITNRSIHSTISQSIFVGGMYCPSIKQTVSHTAAYLSGSQ